MSLLEDPPVAVSRRFCVSVCAKESMSVLGVRSKRHDFEVSL
jgi:hypothetical protein